MCRLYSRYSASIGRPMRKLLRLRSYHIPIRPTTRRHPHRRHHRPPQRMHVLTFSKLSPNHRPAVRWFGDLLYSCIELRSLEADIGARHGARSG